MTNRVFENRSARRRLLDSVWGYDFFISYNQESSQKYATVLAERLRQEGHEVFIDHDEIPAGGDLSDTIRASIARTQALIVIGTREALGGSKPWVGREVLLFQRTNRQCFPILFPNSFERSAPDAEREQARRFLEDSDRLQIRETLENLNAGHPDETVVIKKLTASLNVMRRKKLRLFITSTVFASLVLFSLFAALMWGNAEYQKGIAKTEQAAAEKARDKATESQDLSEQRRAELYLHNAHRAIQSDHDIPTAALWYAEILDTTGHRAEPLRTSARLLLGGSINLLPAYSLANSNRILAIEFSPGNETLATFCDTNGNITLPIVHLHEANTGHICDHLKHLNGSGLLLFSNDGKTLVTVKWREARLWDALTGQPRGESLSHDHGVDAASFSPDGMTLATVNWRNKTFQLWDTLTGKPIGDLRRHDGACALTLRFSPDSKMLATTCGCTVWRWDTVTGQACSLPLKHSGVITAMSFSPDGATLATASDNTVTLWNKFAEDPLGNPIKHAGKVVSLQFMLNGTALVTVSEDATARLWDVLTGQPRSQQIINDQRVRNVVVSPDGTIFASTSADATQLWDAHTGQPRGEPLKHYGHVPLVGFSPDGKTLVAASDKVWMWDAISGTPRYVPFKHDEPVRQMSFSSDGKTLATASSHMVRLWDTLTGESLCEPFIHDHIVNAISFGKDGKQLAIGGDDKAVRVVPVLPEQTRGEWLRADGRVSRMSFSPDGKTLATVGESSARLWNVITRRPRGGPLNHDGRVYSTSFSPDNRMFATASGDNMARLWDAITGELRRRPLKLDGAGNDVSFSPDSKLLATASGDLSQGKAQLWDVLTGRPCGDPLEHDSAVLTVSFSLDGRMVATGSNDRTARLWNTITYKPHCEPLKHYSRVIAIRFGSDGESLATASNDGTVQLWNAFTGQALGKPLELDGNLDRILFSSDGKTLATEHRDVKVCLWDAVTGSPRCKPVNHDSSTCYDISLSPDGKTLATAHRDGKVWLWDTTTGHKYSKPLKHSSKVVALAFSPDGKMLASAHEDCSVQFWDVIHPVPDESKRVKLSIEVRTIRTIKNGLVRTMTVDEWQERRRQLDELGGDCLHWTWDDLDDAEKLGLSTPSVSDSRDSSLHGGKNTARMRQADGDDDTLVTRSATLTQPMLKQRNTPPDAHSSERTSLLQQAQLGSEPAKGDRGEILVWLMLAYASLPVLLVVIAHGHRSKSVPDKINGTLSRRL